MHAMQFLDVPVLAREFLRQHGEFALDAFLVTGRDAQLERPVRPDQHLVFHLGRLRHDLEIGNRHGALADRGADAVGAGIAAADHDDLLALGENRLDVALRLVAHPPVLLRQEIHGEMDALELAAGHRQVARLLGAAREHDGVVLLHQLVDRDVDADIGAVMELHAFALHLLDAAVDVDLFHLEVGNAVAQQPAGLGPALVDMHLMSGARELLRASQAGRAGADDGDLLAGLVRRHLRLQTFRDRTVGDLAFDGFDRDRVVVDIERAGRLARRRTDAAGEIREIVGRVQVARGLVPMAAIDQIVPVRNLVVHRAAGGRAGDAAGAVAIGHAAIHAARSLVADVLVRQRQHEFVPVLDTLLDRVRICDRAVRFRETQ